MKKKSFKICTTIIFFLLSIQSAFCENLVTPKPKPNLTKEKKDKNMNLFRMGQDNFFPKKNF